MKSTRRDEYYLTITESKKRFEQDGNFHFEKHKIFLYREDFEKFVDGLQEVISYIDQNQGEDYELGIHSEFDEERDKKEKNLEAVDSVKNYSNIEFDDLSK